MPPVSRHSQGSFCWAELVSADLDRTVAFYQAVFGWEPEQTTGPLGVQRTVFHQDGHAVAGCVQQSEQTIPESMCPGWLNFISVVDCAPMVASAVALGARVVHHPQLGDERFIQALLIAPDGTALGLWQPIFQQGYALKDEPGSVVWQELATPDVAIAKKFYGDWLGWAFEAREERPGFVYTTASHDDERRGGLFEKPAHWRPSFPYWIPYFGVTDLEATLATIEQQRGTVLCGPMYGLPGTWCIVTGPSGEVFAVLRI